MSGLVFQDGHVQPSGAVLRLHEDLSELLDRVREHFAPGSMVTLVVRNPSSPGDAGVVIGNDDLEQAIAEIRRRQTTEALARAESKPTAKQLETLRYMQSFITEHGFSPTVREIGDHFGLTPHAALDRLRGLAKKGLAKSAPGVTRSWRPA